jgi:hypothetical protein
MLSSRYQQSFGYRPLMAATGRPRNALASIYAEPPPVADIDEPIDPIDDPAPDAPAPAPTPEPAPTAAPPPRPLPTGDGVGFGGGEADSFDPGDGYGTGGPKGAPSTGNFMEDARNFAGLMENPIGALGALGPLGVPAAALGVFGLGALNAFAPETAARVGQAVFGYGGQPANDPALGNPGETPTPDGGNFGAGANVTGGNFADPSMTSTPDLSGSFGAIGPTSMDGITGNPDGNLGNLGDFGTPAGGNFGDGANSDGGAGMNSGGDSNTSDGTAGLGSSGTWRYGGYTGHGQDGDIDPDAEAGTVHEGEYVLRHEATQHYGPDIMHALNSGMIPRNALAALTMQRRPQAANHLLQMMMR